MEQPSAINAGAAPGSNDDPQHSNENSQSRAPDGSASAAAPISLSQRAPVDLIATRIWRMYVNLGPASVEYESSLEQIQCIRSQQIHTHATWTGATTGIAHTRFPYPRAFLRALGHETKTRPWWPTGLTILEREAVVERPSPPGAGPGLGPGLGAPGVNAGGAVNRGPMRYAQSVRKVVGFTNNFFGVTWSSVTEVEVDVEPMYIVIGIFRRGNPNPRERIVFVHKPEHLFRKLHWGAYRLRGLRSTFFSLTHVRGFRLYKCNAEKGTHERVELDRNGMTDLQLLLSMYKNWFVDHTTAQVWANWLHQALNDGSNDVPNGTYALELVLGWSATRISVVVLLPVLLSLAVGLYLNSQNWSDLTTIQTAWGTASYVVTTGGLLAALLAILSSIETDPRRE